jgi:hypothetical protein
MGIQLAISFVGLLLIVPYTDHYAAPLTAIVFAIIVQAFRHLRHWQYRGTPIGIGFTRLLVICALVLLPAHMVKKMLEIRHGIVWENPEMPERAKIAAQLETTTGEHLVIVHYSPHHLVHQEWVYNAADIDHSKVVWARDIPGMDLKPLLNYFQNRTVWMVDADKIPAQLMLFKELTNKSTCER